MTTTALKHFYMVSGIVAFVILTDENEIPEPRSITVNAIVRQNSKNFPAHALARAQRNMQAVALTKFPDEIKQSIRFQDTIIQTITHLGHMSEADFQAPPKGQVQVVETAPEVV